MTHSSCNRQHSRRVDASSLIQVSASCGQSSLGFVVVVVVVVVVLFPIRNGFDCYCQQIFDGYRSPDDLC